MGVPTIIVLALTITSSLCTDAVGRRKRAVLGNIEVETVIILDAEYVAIQRKQGHATNKSLEDQIKLKWTGVQAEWSREDILGYNVTILIKDIVIWENNPSWYVPSTVLDYTLGSICSGARNNNLWTKYDHIHMYTGHKSTDVSGKAYMLDICTPGRKCAVSTNTGVDEYWISTHELGHSLGMAHDGDVGCPKPNDGIMGSKNTGWSGCSAGAFKYLMTQTSASCLQTTDVSTKPLFTLSQTWPGMVYTADEICEHKYGNGFRLKSSRTSCSAGSCMYMGTNQTMLGVIYTYRTPTDGSYCGDEMVCSTQYVGGSYECISWQQTGLDVESVVKIRGGWSEWTEMTSCSRTCGSGIRYKQRFCNTTTPRNSAWCEGNEFYAEMCNTQACADDAADETTLVAQRAGETCIRWKNNNIFEVIGESSSNYLTTGDRFGTTGYSQCEVQCDTVEGYSAGNKRHGVMPDGTPCSPESLSSYEEVNNLPRKSGRYSRCVRGFCYCFGCDNTTACTSKDGCGVCGGDNSTCRIVEGVFDTFLASKETATVAVLPQNSYNIQFYFQYNSMSYHFLEILNSALNYRSTSTINYAGTDWYQKRTKQYLYAYGPINQTVTVQLFNYAASNNTGVYYAFSIYKDCREPANISHGFIHLDAQVTTVGATATLTCSTGYKPNKSRIVCQPNEKWEFAECAPTDCKQPPTIPHGEMRLDVAGVTTFGASASLTCDTGYTPNTETIRCTVMGTWEPAFCSVNDCGQVRNISNGTVKLSKPKETTVGSFADVVCISGFYPSRSVIQCTVNGIWQNASCLPASKPSIPTDFKHVTELVTETSVTLQWKTGFNGGMEQTFVLRIYKSEMDTWETEIKLISEANVMNYTVRNLESGTKYMFVIYATNEMGNSSSLSITIETKGSKESPEDHKFLLPILLPIFSALIAVFVVLLAFLQVRRCRRRKARKMNGRKKNGHRIKDKQYTSHNTKYLYSTTRDEMQAKSDESAT